MKRVHKKGDAGEILFTIFAAILIFFFLMVVMTSVTSSNQKSQEIVLEELAIVKAKNTFFLVERSLGMTWYVSAVQSIFRTGYESMGCGIDEEDEGIPADKADKMKDNYWYQYSDTKLPKKSGLPAAADKYNFDILTITDAAPLICYPRGAVPGEEGRLLAYLSKKFVPFKDIPDKFTANGVPFVIQNMQTGFVVEDDEIDVKSEQDVTANPNAQPTIIAPVINNNVIFTKFKQVVEGARKIVDAALAMSNSLKLGQRPGSELLYTTASAADRYRLGAKNLIKNRFQSVLPKNAFRIDVTYKPGNDISLRAGDENEMGYKDASGSQYQFTKQGLILHYDADIKIQENFLGTSGSSLVCKTPQFENIIRQKIEAADNGGEWSIGGFFGTYKLSYDEVQTLVEAMIQQESDWDPNAVSTAGAIGLMQIVPSQHPECTGDLKDPATNIECGVNFLYTLMNEITDEKDEGSRDNMIKLSLAAYNSGKTALYNYIECAKKIGGETPTFYQWDSLTTTYRQCIVKRDGTPNTETINYVSAVLACDAYYKGGTSKLGDYAWPTASKQITSCFGYRNDPVTGEPGKFHAGIDIGADKGSDVFSAETGDVEGVNTGCKEGDASCGGGYGNYILIKNSDGRSTFYAHLQEGSITLATGDAVSKGMKIAQIGSTGKSTGPHTHFEVRQDTTTLNPCNFMDCTQSTGLKCQGEIDTSFLSGIYYYHDENNNRFTPRPFELDMSVEDNLDVLNCINDVPGGNNPPPFVLYQWSVQGDMACCGGALWTCNAQPEINNIENHALQSFQNVLGQDDPKPVGAQPSRICAGAVSNSLPNPDNKKYTLGCTPSGFGVVEYLP